MNHGGITDEEQQERVLTIASIVLRAFRIELNGIRIVHISTDNSGVNIKPVLYALTVGPQLLVAKHSWR